MSPCSELKQDQTSITKAPPIDQTPQTEEEGVVTKGEVLKGGLDEDASKDETESVCEEGEVAEDLGDVQQIGEEEDGVRGDSVNGTEEAMRKIGSTENVSTQNGDKVGGCEKVNEGKRAEVDPFEEQGEWTVVGKRKALCHDNKAMSLNRVKRYEGREFQGFKQGNLQTYRGRFVHQPVARPRAPSNRCSVAAQPVL
ncbi:hypothetical protein U1Q18_040548 [Sarracenia purpurea var. burkii]